MIVNNHASKLCFKVPTALNKQMVKDMTECGKKVPNDGKDISVKRNNIPCTCMEKDVCSTDVWSCAGRTAHCVTSHRNAV